MAQLLMVVTRKKLPHKTFADMIVVIRLRLMSYVELFEFIKDTYQAWRKSHNAPNAFVLLNRLSPTTPTFETMEFAYSPLSAKGYRGFSAFLIGQ